MNILNIIFTVNIALLALDHFVTGSLALFFPKTASKLYTHLFGVKLIETKELQALLKPWGALGIFASIVGATILSDPHKYKIFLLSFFALLVMRMFIRFIYRHQAEKTINLSIKRNAFHLALIVLSAILLLGQFFTQ